MELVRAALAAGLQPALLELLGVRMCVNGPRYNDILHRVGYSVEYSAGCGRVRRNTTPPRSSGQTNQRGFEWSRDCTAGAGSKMGPWGQNKCKRASGVGAQRQNERVVARLGARLQVRGFEAKHT